MTATYGKDTRVYYERLWNRQIVGAFKKIGKARKMLKEFKEAYGEIEDVVASIKTTRSAIAEAWKDKKLSPQERDHVYKQAVKTFDEVEEAFKEVMDIVNMFK